LKFSNKVQFEQDYTKTNYNQTVKNQKQREDPEAAKEKKHITYKRTLIHLSADFSAETLQTKRP
jgi:hypothetical protein